MTEIGLPLSILLVAATALLCIGFPILHMAKGVITVEAIKKGAIGIAVFVALYLVMYFVGDDPTQEYLELRKVSSSIYKNVGAALGLMYILTIAAFGCIVWTEIKGFIK